ncbi:serine/threonine-protein phosphatase 7 long form-like protein, partial [Trifolium medium]|nr:serine/threonine-protein phosphatase 7 long form-like protein [Trifolium medium]
MPRNAKFVPGGGHKDSSGYRQSLDNIQTYDCVFSPYDDHRQVRPLINSCWFSGWLRSGNLKTKYLLERVLRQFLHVQGIPRNPDTSATPGMNLFEIDRVFMEELELRMVDEQMR